MSQGTKGQRLFDWAILPQVLHGTVDGCHWLVIRRCLDAPFEKAYYLVFAPPGTTLQTMVLAEREHAGRSRSTWKTPKILASISTRCAVTSAGTARSPSSCSPQSFCLGSVSRTAVIIRSREEPTTSPPLITLSTSEVRHLLARLIWPAPTSAPLICQWSWWRRAHQYWAGYYHRRRREKAG